MNLKIFIGILLSASILFQPILVFAFETDQYNLPPVPLIDIGDQVTEYTENNIRDAVRRVNKKIRSIDKCPEKAIETKCRISNRDKKRFAELRSEDAIAKAVFKEMGDGIIPFTKSSWWIEGHKFGVEPVRYKPGIKKSIYVTAPFNQLTLSSTVKLYGEEFGTDKIAHIFQQGYDYHKIYQKALAKGSTEKAAIEKAVKWGQKTERTYFGTWVSGVYSNADLYSNYAGLKFYLGLTRDIEIGEDIRPATLSIKDGFWVFNENENFKDNLLKPFITKHLNEAYNPNKFFNVFKFRKVIKKVVRKRACKQWFERYPNLNKGELEETTKSLELWHGEDYGFSTSKKFITIANTCFEKGAERMSPRPNES